MLEIRGLEAGVKGNTILKGIDLVVNAGEVHAIMGPNGSGKSTLAQVIAGREQFVVSAGSVEYDGRDLLELTPEERACAGIFMAFQYPVEIPGVSNSYFLRSALNAQRRARGEQDNDNWSVDLDSQFEMAEEFDLMLKEIDDYEYPANSVIVVNQRTIVREIYYNDFSYSTQFNTYSVTKSFTSVLVGIAIDQGIIGSVDDPVVSYFPNTTLDDDSPEKQSVTIKHILTMTSGFDYGVDPTFAPPVEGSMAMHVLNSPVNREPGTSWVYDSQAPSILTRIIEIQSNMSLIDFANETLFDPLGIQEVAWGTDDSGLAYGGFGL